MTIKQSLFIFALFTFSAQAMEEIKVNNEQEENKKNLEQVYSDINQSCPTSVKFLIRVLGRKLLPEELASEVIDYLVVPLSKTPENFVYGHPTTIRLKPTIPLLHRMYWELGPRIDDLHLTVGRIKLEYSSLENNRVLITKQGRTATTDQTYENIVNKLALDINPKQSNEPNQANYKIILWIKNNKLKSLVAASAGLGTLWYLVKKIRK